MVKNPPAKQETWVQSLVWEDPLEEEMATYYSFLPGKSHGRRSLAGYTVQAVRELDVTNWTCTRTHLEEGN